LIALSAIDFPLQEKHSYFKQLLLNWAYCRNVETIYPFVTYPYHATLVNGNFTNWHQHHIKRTALYDESKHSGYGP
jgi:hypothetical protein